MSKAPTPPRPICQVVGVATLPDAGPIGGVVRRCRVGTSGPSTPETFQRANAKVSEALEGQQRFALKKKKKVVGPWLVWLSGLSTGLRMKPSPVGFPVGAQAWVGQVPRREHVRGNHTLMFLSLSSPLSKHK